MRSTIFLSRYYIFIFIVIFQSPQVKGNFQENHFILFCDSPEGLRLLCECSETGPLGIGVDRDHQGNLPCMGADSLLIVSHETHNVDSTLSQ